MYENYDELGAARSGVVPLDMIVETIIANHGVSQDIDIFVKAYDFSKKVHKKDTRQEINPNTNGNYAFFSHASQAAMITADAQHDFITAAITVLHDTIDISGNPMLYRTIRKKFGREIAKSVAVLTGFDAYSKAKDGFEKVTWKKDVVKDFIIQSILYPRAIIAKLADRLNNYMSIDTHNTPAKERITLETQSYLLSLAKIADPKLHYGLELVSGRVKFEHPFMLQYVNNLKVPYDDATFSHEVSLVQKMQKYKAGKMASAFVNSSNGSKRKLSNVFSQDIARHGFDQVAGKFRDIPEIEVNYLSQAINLVQILDKVLLAESYIGAVFSIDFGEPSCISQVKSGKDAFGKKVYSLNISTDNFTEDTVEEIKSKYKLEGPLYVLMEDQPRYRMIFDVSNSPILRLAGTPEKHILVNVYTK